MVIRRNRRVVEFHFYKSHAHDVSLAGDFNNWNPGATPMCQSQDGDWVCRMALPEGIYHFKYVADGKWYPDYAAFGLEPGPYGLNSVLLVEKLTDTIQPSVQPSVPKQNPHKTRRHPPHSRFKCSVA